MEIVNAYPRKNYLSSIKTITRPCDTKYIKKYIQPPRAKTFAPERLYKVPSKRFETITTYHSSYLDVDHITRYARSQPIRPIHSLEKSSGKFLDETTNRLSYKPVWQIVKPVPIIPKRRPIGQGIMETMTTVRYNYVPKHIEKQEAIIPQENIRTSSAPLDDKTMTKLSYIHPGSVEPIINFKPILKYHPPSQPIPKETTQKLSYQPFIVDKKEFYPWTQKPIYKQPEVAMSGKTIYSESFMENDITCTEQPILPTTAYIFPYGAKFVDNTVYKESYMTGEAKRVEPIIPCNNISIPNIKMSADTTSKLSYQQIWTEKRTPFVPRSKSMIGTDGIMQSETTTRCEYVPKMSVRPDLIVPCNNILTAKVPLEGNTTTKLSFTKPGVVKSVHSYKPVMQYRRPEIKIDPETVTKLSYQAWMLQPKEELPWIPKKSYQPPVHLMANDTVYHMSFSAPGHYIEDSLYIEDSCRNGKDDLLSVPAEATS